MRMSKTMELRKWNQLAKYHRENSSESGKDKKVMTIKGSAPASESIPMTTGENASESNHVENGESTEEIAKRKSHKEDSGKKIVDAAA